MYDMSEFLDDVQSDEGTECRSHEEMTTDEAAFLAEVYAEAGEGPEPVDEQAFYLT